MKILKHFVQTILMLLSVLLIAMMPADKYAHIINPLLGIAIISVLIFTAFYLYRGHKKGLFCFLALFLFSVSSSGIAYADACYDLSDKLRGEYYHDFKKEKDNFDPKDAFKNNDPPKQEVIDKAVGFIDTVNRALDLGCLKYDGDWGVFEDIISNSRGMNSVWSEFYDDLYDAANDYLEKVADYRKLAKETRMTSPMAYLRLERDSCWICGIVHLTIDTTERVTLAMEGHLKHAALILLGIMTLFWILIKVLILIGQFGTASNADFFTELLTRLFLVVIAAAILQAPLGQLYRVTISPLISITSKLTQQYTNYGDQSQGIGSIGNNENLKCACCDAGSENDCNGGTLIEYGAQYNDAKFVKLVNRKNATGDNIYEGVLDLEAKRDLMCMVCSVYKQTAPLVAAGRTLVYFSWNLGPQYLDFWQSALRGIIKFATGLTFPFPFGMWFVGTIVILIFTWLALNIALKFIDIFLRFGFVLILTPFLVTAYVFPISRKYTQRGWEFLVHTMVTILAIGIGIALIMSILMVQLGDGGKIKDLIGKPEDQVTQFYAADLWRAIIGAAKGNRFGDSDDKDVWASTADTTYFPLFMMIVICFAGTKLLNSMSVIVQGLTGISADLPSMAAAAVMSAIRAAYAPFKMAIKVIQDRLDAFKGKPGKPGGNPSNKGGKKPGALSRFEKWSGAKADSLDNVGKAAGKATQATGTAIEKGGELIGSMAKEGGQAATEKGKNMISSGNPLGIIVGTAFVTAGVGAQVAGHVVEKGSKIVGKVVKATGKVMEKAGKVANKLVKPLAKGMRATSRFAGKVNKKVKDFGKKARGIKNRMKKMVPPKVRKFFKDRKKKKQNRRTRSKNKYGRSRMSDFLGNIDATIEKSLDGAENSLGAK